MIRLILQGKVLFEGADHEQLFSFRTAAGRDLVMCAPYLPKLRKRHPEQWELIEVPITDADTQHLIATRGINLAHVKTIDAKRGSEPGWAIFLDDGSFLVVDGNHRYVWRSRAGLPSMAFHACRSPEHWRPALVDVEASALLIRQGLGRRP